jgi:hypothetical protein
MPDRSTVLRWRDTHPGFAEAYERARVDGAEAEFDSLRDIEMDVLKGKIDPSAGRTVLVSRQWRLAKLCPRLYKDRTENEHTGKDGAPLQSQVSVVLGNLTDAELDTLDTVLAAAESRARGVTTMPKPEADK